MENKVLNCELCGPCKRDGCNESMYSLYIDCAEALCQDCDKHHRKSKTSASHNTVPLQKLKVPAIFYTNLRKLAVTTLEVELHFIVQNTTSFVVHLVSRCTKKNVTTLELWKRRQQTSKRAKL